MPWAPLTAEGLVWLSPSYTLPRTEKSMGQGNILIHAPTPPIPDSNTHRLSWETQIPSTNGPSSLSGPVQESVPLRADLAADVHTPRCSVPREWLAVGWDVYLVNSERQVEKSHLKSLDLETM